MTDSESDARRLPRIVSGTAGAIAGIKTGMALGSIFGPPGMALGAIIGACIGSDQFVRSVDQSDHPITTTAWQIARAATGMLPEIPQDCGHGADEVPDVRTGSS